MKVVGNVNKLHDSVKPARLNPGEVAVYRLLGGVPNPDGESAKKKPIIWRQSVTIPATDRVKSLNADGEEDYIDIALVGSYNNQTKEVTPKKITVPAAANDGYILCTGGQIADEELYEYLELTNYNQSNEKRDPSVEPLFYRINEEKDAQVRVKRRNALRSALTYIDDLSAGQVREIAAAQNWNEDQPVPVLLDKLGAWAQKDPEGFIKAVYNKENEVKALLKTSVTKGIISYDVAQHKIVNVSTGQALIKLDRVEGMEWLDQAAEWIRTHKNGANVLAQIKKLKEPKPENATEEK